GFIEIAGTEGTLAMPDPNTFGGDIRLRSFGADEWTVLPSVGAVNGRGLGVLDMARAARSGSGGFGAGSAPSASGAMPRASGELGLHVVDTMETIETSIADGEFRPVHSEFRMPEMLEADWDPEARTLGG